ncbi:MAG: hypothetical protein ACOCVS_02780 [Planctomycetota bacterium]
MRFDISRDFLDGIAMQQPNKGNTGNGEIKVNGGLHFLPSSPDGTMHTAIVSLGLLVDGQEQPFARGGWRILFTTDEKFDPKQQSNNQFYRTLMVLGCSKLVAQVNNLCMHANLPLMPFDANQLAAAVAQQAAAKQNPGEDPATGPQSTN